MRLITRQVPNKFGINVMAGALDKAPARTVKLKEIADWGEDQYFRSQELDTGELKYYLFVHIQDVHGYDFDFNYIASVMVVSPERVSKETRDEYLSSLGDDEDPDSLDSATLAFRLCETGCGATVYEETGKNRAKLTRQAKQECEAVAMLFGFYLDRPVNMIGTTGWDMLEGNIMAGLDRYRAAQQE